MITTRLCLVRHGETAWNAERRIQGQLDEPLSVLGHAQARATAKILVQEDFAAVYASDLSRAQQTAEAIARLRGCPVRLEAGLRERHYGVFQTRTYDEMRRDFPREYARFMAREIDFVLPGGESLRQFAQRVLHCVEAIVAAHAGGQVLIATHGGVLDILHRRVTGKPLDAPRDFEIPNAALNWLEIADGRWTLLSWAERSHLSASLDELPG